MPKTETITKELRHLHEKVDLISEDIKVIKAREFQNTELALFDVRDLHHILKMSERNIWRIIHSGELGSILIGHRRYVPYKVLSKYIEDKVNNI